MLRFAVHGLAQRRGSPRCHGPSGRDVESCVQVRMAGETTRRAPERRLALTTVPVHVRARRAHEARVRGVDLLDPVRGLVVEAPHEGAPAGGEDRPVQPGLGSHVAAGFVDGPRCGSGHVGDPQILDPDQVEPPGEAGGGLLDPVPPPGGLAGAEPVDPGLCAAQSVRCRTAIDPLPAGLAAQPGQPPRLTRRQAGHAQRLPARRHRRDSHTAVDTDDRPGARSSDRGRDVRERDVPAPGRVPAHPVGAGVRHRATATEPHPPDLRDQDLRPATTDLADPQGLLTHDPEPLVPTALAPRRPLVGAAPPVLQRLLVIPQRLLLHRRRALGQPPESGAGLGQLPISLRVAGDLLPVVAVPGLLDRQVPHEPGMPTMPQQTLDLLRAGIHPIPAHTRRIAGHPDTIGSCSSVLPPEGRGLHPETPVATGRAGRVGGDR